MGHSVADASIRRKLPEHRAHDVGEFRSIVSNSFVPLNITRDLETPFSANVRTVDVDRIAFTEVAANPHLVSRTPETIADGGSGFYKVSLLLAGSSVLVQDGKELVMTPGELTIYDTSRPYSLLFDQNFRNIVMMFPKEQLDVPLPFSEQLTAVSLSQEHQTISPIVTSFLSKFPRQLSELSGSTRSRLARTSLELLGTLCSEIMDIAQVETDPQSQLMQRIMLFIEQHLASADLSPTVIAAAHYISTRHLHGLFAQREHTVSSWIKERRLERCAQDLSDPLCADLTILAIAIRWGFTDAAHFSRAFKHRYGVTPREARSRA